MNLEIPERLRRPVKWVGYPLFGFVVFLIALYASLPRGRIQDRLQTDASTWLSSDVKAEGFGLTLFSGPGVSADSVIIATRPLLASDKPVRYSADDVVIDFSLYQLMRGFADTSWHGDLLGGHAEGQFKSVPEEGVLVADAKGVELAKLPTIGSSMGIPIDGKIDLKIDVTTPKNLASQANGSVKVDVANASIGDGKAKLTIPGGDPFLSQGVTLPKIALGTVSGSVSIEKGRATFRDLRAHSRDVDVELEGYVELRDPVSLSVVHAYLKFKPSEALTKREGTIDLMNQMLGPTAKRSDGFLGFTINGTLAGVFFLPSKEPPAGVGGHDLGGPTGPRPPAVSPLHVALPSPAAAPLPNPPINYDVPPPAVLPPPPAANDVQAAAQPPVAAPPPAVPPTGIHAAGLRNVVEAGGAANPTGPPAVRDPAHDGEGEGKPLEGEQKQDPPPAQ